MVEDPQATYTLRVEAPSLKEALRSAAEQLGIPEASLRYTVVQEASSKFLGLKKSPCVVLIHKSADLKLRMTKQGIFLFASGKTRPEDVNAFLAARGIRHLQSPDPAALEISNQWIRLGDSIADPDEDSKAIVAIDEDQMAARITVSAPGSRGLSFELADIVHVLEEDGGIRYGIDEPLITRMLDGEQYGEPVVVARGKAPEHGQDARIEYAFPAEKTGLSFAVDEHGAVDLKNLNLFASVTAGQVVARKHPATRAASGGRTVMGKTLEGRDGLDAVSLKVGKNVVLDPDGLTATSKITGRVDLVDGAIVVEPILEIRDDVNYKTGNINFKGNVIVHGSVDQGFVVKATGNIEIGGTVGNARVEAEGDVLVKQGVLAKANVAAQGDVIARFIEHATVRAGRDVLVGGDIMSSQVEAGKRVECKGAQGSLIGGHIRAAEEIRATTVGSRMAVATTLEVGLDAELRKAFATATPEKFTELRDKLASEHRWPRIIVSKQILPGVRITIFDKTRKITDEMISPTIELTEAGVVLAKPGG